MRVKSTWTLLIGTFVVFIFILNNDVEMQLKEVYYLFICAPTKMTVFLQMMGKAIVVSLLQCPLSLGSILQGLVDLNRHLLAIRRLTASHCRGIGDVRQLDLAGKMWNSRS